MDTHHLLEPTEALDAIQQVEGVLAEGGAYLVCGFRVSAPSSASPSGSESGSSLLPLVSAAVILAARLLLRITYFYAHCIWAFAHS